VTHGYIRVQWAYSSLLIKSKSNLMPSSFSKSHIHKNMENYRRNGKQQAESSIIWIYTNWSYKYIVANDGVDFTTLYDQPKEWH